MDGVECMHKGPVPAVGQRSPRPSGEHFAKAIWVNDAYGRLVELLLFAGAVYFIICFSASQIVKRLQAGYRK